jgi:hypothetical protein
MPRLMLAAALNMSTTTMILGTARDRARNHRFG